MCCDSLMFDGENAKEIIKREVVCTPRYKVLLIFINFNFDFVAIYEMYFQNFFANRSIEYKVSQTIYNIRVRVVLDIQLSPLAQVCTS